jgi:hypothetical protein
VLSFLKVQIGYRKGDCGWQLAQSDAGLRFLGLAACLGSLDPWNAALVLHRSIHATAADKTLTPTPQQLKQLVLAVEDRLARSGFAESVLGWSHIFMDECDSSEVVQGSVQFPSDKFATRAAPNDAVVALTQAMSRLARVGERLQRIEILTVATHAAWLVAFVKWCLGTPPTIVFRDGRSLAPDGDPQVVLRVLKSVGQTDEIRIDVHDYTGKIENLVRTLPSRAGFTGLVSVSAYGKAVLRTLFGTQTDLPYRACAQALPYACALVLRDLDFRSGLSSRARNLPATEQWIGSETHLTRGRVFPSIARIGQVLHSYLGLDHDESSSTLPEISKETMIQDLSLCSLVKDKLVQMCACGKCTKGIRTPRGSCIYDNFLGNISKCTAQVLAISLFNAADPQGVQLYFGFVGYHGSFVDCIKLILKGGDSQNCSVSDVLEIALRLVGHRAYGMNTWMMSTRYDQTVFPQMLAAQSTSGDEILRLECIPGMLVFEGERYEIVQVDLRYLHPDLELEDPGADSATGAALDSSSRPRKLERGSVLTPRDAFAGFELQWQLGVQENSLSVAVTIPKFPTIPSHNPMRVLDSAAESIFVSCSHDRMENFISTTASDVYITNPLDPRPTSSPSDSIGIIESDQNEHIRFFTLATGRPAVVRLDACLDCSVKCCQMFDSYSYVLL